MDALSFAAAIVLWGVLPGLALLAALAAGGSLVERLAAAPGLSIALVAFAAYATELAGLPVAPLQVAAVTLSLCAGLFLLTRALPPSSGRLDHLHDATSPGLSWIPWLVLLLPPIIVQDLRFLTTEVLLPPTLHDGLDHANWFRLIYETQSLNPWEVLAPPLSRQGEPTYYPWGMHGWLALVAATTTLDPIAVLMRGLTLISAALPLSVYAFVSLLTGRGWTAVAAAAVSLLFWWLPYQVWGWGGYALLTGAIAALPLSRLALHAADRWHAPALLAAAVCGLGTLVVHPSQAMAGLIVCVVVSVTLAANRLMAWTAAAPFGAAFAAAGLLFTAGASLWGPLAAFVDNAARIAARYSARQFDWPIGVYTPTALPLEAQIAVAVLSIAGVVVAWRTPPARAFLLLHIVFSLLIPLARAQTWVTALWYHAPERLWYAQYASVPALAALGLAGLVMAVERVLARRPRLRVARLVVWPAAVALLWAPLSRPYDAWIRRQLFLHAHRNPTGTITDRRILADYAWIDAHVPRGEVLFNAPADWGLPLPFTGRRTVFWSGGHAMDPMPRWYQLLDALGLGDPAASQAAAELRALGVRYLYAATISPSLEAGRQRLNRQVLAKVAALELLYQSPTADVFRVRDSNTVLLGVYDDERIQFEGFHPAQTDGRRHWRWTIGDGRVRVRTVGLPDGPCRARIHGPDPGQYFFRIDGDELELTADGFVIPERHRQRDVLEILLRVPEQLRRVEGEGAEARPVGVHVTNVEMQCG